MSGIYRLVARKLLAAALALHDVEPLGPASGRDGTIVSAW